MDASHIENVSIEGSKMLSDKWVLWAHLPQQKVDGSSLEN